MGRRALSETGDGQILRDCTLIFTVANNNGRPSLVYPKVWAKFVIVSRSGIDFERRVPSTIYRREENQQAAGIRFFHISPPSDFRRPIERGVVSI